MASIITLIIISTTINAILVFTGKSWKIWIFIFALILTIEILLIFNVRHFVMMSDDVINGYVSVEDHFICQSDFECERVLKDFVNRNCSMIKWSFLVSILTQVFKFKNEIC
jgi:hypothetical protein